MFSIFRGVCLFIFVAVGAANPEVDAAFALYNPTERFEWAHLQGAPWFYFIRHPTSEASMPLNRWLASRALQEMCHLFPWLYVKPCVWLCQLGLEAPLGIGQKPSWLLQFIQPWLWPGLFLHTGLRDGPRGSRQFGKPYNPQHVLGSPKGKYHGSFRYCNGFKSPWKPLQQCMFYLAMQGFT